MSKKSKSKRRTPRLFPPTTTKEGKRAYQQFYMRNYMREKRGTTPDRYGKPGRKPKRVLLRDIEHSIRDRLRERRLE